jgi:hypothetical protein
VDGIIFKKPCRLHVKKLKLKLYFQKELKIFGLNTQKKHADMAEKMTSYKLPVLEYLAKYYFKQKG